MDTTDLKILKMMQENARISNAAISRNLDMAPSAVLERIRKLESKDIIRGYEVRINPESLDYGLVAFIFVREIEGKGSWDTGGQLAKIPEVLEVHHVAAGGATVTPAIRVAQAALGLIDQQGVQGLGGDCTCLGTALGAAGSGGRIRDKGTAVRVSFAHARLPLFRYAIPSAETGMCYKPSTNTDRCARNQAHVDGQIANLLFRTCR